MRFPPGPAAREALQPWAPRPPPQGFLQCLAVVVSFGHASATP